MSGEAGGWMWLLLDVAAVAVLGVALAYGVMVWRKRRSPAAEAARDRATRNLYHSENGASEGSPGRRAK
jgi:hypothetical protein